MLEAQLSEAFALPEGSKLGLPEAKRRAMAFYNLLKLTEDGKKEIEADYWYHLSDNWDLNIFKWETPRRGEFYKVDLYRVDELSYTKTGKWYVVFEEKVIDNPVSV